jgi:hypothetical protein
LSSKKAIATATSAWDEDGSPERLYCPLNITDATEFRGVHMKMERRAPANQYDSLQRKQHGYRRSGDTQP